MPSNLPPCRPGGDPPAARPASPRPAGRGGAPSPALLTVAAVADRLAVSPRHVRRLIAGGTLPVHRLGRVVRISEDDLARYLASTRYR